jgi:hypothetical protein
MSLQHFLKVYPTFGTSFKGSEYFFKKTGCYRKICNTWTHWRCELGVVG